MITGVAEAAVARGADPLIVIRAKPAVSRTK
jgi:hypothetical protein